MTHPTYAFTALALSGLLAACGAPAEATHGSAMPQAEAASNGCKGQDGCKGAKDADASHAKTVDATTDEGAQDDKKKKAKNSCKGAAGCGSN